MKKEKIIKRTCGQCNRWYNGCFDTDYDFWSGERDANKCKYYKVKFYNTKPEIVEDLKCPEYII